MTIICRVSIHRGCHTSCIGIAATHLVPTRDGLALNLTFFSLELFSRNVHMPTFCLKFNFVSNRSHSSTIIMISFLLQKSQVFLDFLKIKLKLLVAKFIGYGLCVFQKPRASVEFVYIFQGYVFCLRKIFLVHQKATERCISVIV